MSSAFIVQGAYSYHRCSNCHRFSYAVFSCSLSLSHVLLLWFTARVGNSLACLKVQFVLV